MRLARPGAASCSCTTTGTRSSAGRDHARQRRVAAEAHDDARPVAAHDRDRAERTRQSHRQSAATFASVRRRCSPRPGSRSIANPASGTTRPSMPRRAADEAHRVARASAAPARPRSPDTCDRRCRRRRAARRPSSLTTDGAPRPRAGRLAGGRAFVAARGGRGARRRATFATMPAPSIVITSDEPPADRNGSVMPDTGSRPTTAPRLITACPTIHAVTPAATSVPKRSGARRATRKPTRPKPGEQPEHEQAADEAELLADDREDEVGVRVREEHPLGAAGAEPDAVHAAAAERDQRLRDLVAGVRRVLATDAGTRTCGPAGSGAANASTVDEHRRRRRRASARWSRAARRRRSSTANAMSASTIVESRSGSFITSDAEHAEHDEHRPPRARVVRAGRRGARGSRRRRRAARASRARSAACGTGRRRASGAIRRRRCRCRARARPRSNPTATTSSHGAALRQRW